MNTRSLASTFGASFVIAACAAPSVEPPAEEMRTTSLRLEPAIAPPLAYTVAGQATVAISGSGVDDGTRRTGDVQMTYRVLDGGVLVVDSMMAGLADTNIAYSFLFGVESGEIAIRCGSIATEAPVTGTIDPLTGAYSFTAPVRAGAFKSRDSSGRCANVLNATAATVTVTGTLLPSDGDRGTFTMSTSLLVSGYRIGVTGSGGYQNRPPEIHGGFTGDKNAQWADCTPRFDANKQRILEANCSLGYCGWILDVSTDPDVEDGIATSQWWFGADATSLAYIGASRGPDYHTLNLGQSYFLRHEVSDTRASQRRYDCAFRVVDTTSPTGSATLTPSVIPASPGAYTFVKATIASSDAVGPVTVRLVSVTSDDPASAAPLGALYGTDDRDFYVPSDLTAWGAQRNWMAIFSLSDAAGNLSYISAGTTVVPATTKGK